VYVGVRCIVDGGPKIRCRSVGYPVPRWSEGRGTMRDRGAYGWGARGSCDDGPRLHGYEHGLQRLLELCVRRTGGMRGTRTGSDTCATAARDGLVEAHGREEIS
jgi:hypothetical protein